MLFCENSHGGTFLRLESLGPNDWPACHSRWHFRLRCINAAFDASSSTLNMNNPVSRASIRGI